MYQATDNNVVLAKPNQTKQNKTEKQEKKNTPHASRKNPCSASGETLPNGN